MVRSQNISRLQSEAFDLLIIGGGATGAGIALDAAARGLKVALVEKGDFSSGTSSRSTKLVHGGVRYLEQAVMHLDRSQFRLVRDALRERKVLLHNAPHLVRWLPLLVPMYRRLEATYYHAGLRMYDWLAGKSLVHKSRLLSRKEALETCPSIRKAGLRGGVVYYDGQFDDARMNIALLLSAVEAGAAVANYVEVTALEKIGGRLMGAKLRDVQSGEAWSIKAKVVVNATGPFTDSIRKMDDPKAAPLLRVSSGSHITIRADITKLAAGVLIPKTRDKRVLFVLPWQGHALIGTTDNPATVTDSPQATEADIEFMLSEFAHYFEPKITKADILATWCGLRPLVDNSSGGKTAKLSRDHYIGVSPSGLMTVCGGKWTTYRLMAEDAVDEVVREGKFKAKPCSTQKLKVVGAAKWNAKLARELQSEFKLPDDIAGNLVASYGDQAPAVAARGFLERLVPEHPFIVAEIHHAIEKEGALYSADVLCRRLRLWFLDRKAAELAYPKVAAVLAEHFAWSEADQQRDHAHFRAL